MRIEDFPRPKDDNGRGIHWSAIIYHTVITPSLDHWIGELTAMKIKWVKLLDDGGGSSLQFCQQLLDADIMPIVRIYLDPANPNYLRGRELDTVSRLVDIGVRYFESNNEPDLPAEWENNRLPPNWLDIVIDNFIRDADAVLARGGLLALPAMGPGSQDNPISLVVQRGRQDLFQNGCWVAIHNYTLNHPLNYPADDVNQQGRPLTQQEYDELARWQYSHLTYAEIVAQGIPISEADYNKYRQWAWGGRSLDMVNDLRQSNKNPGDTILDDPNCFRGWEVAGHMIYEALGFYVPVISTEGGPVAGWGDDLRYAKMNPTTQRDYQLEIVRFTQSQAPPWYFALCTWLLATEPLGQINPTWEQMSWYTHVWDMQFGLSGRLPIVQALKDEPSLVRPELQVGNSVIEGFVRRSDGQPVAGLALRLTGEGRDMTATTQAGGSYRFAGLAAGAYSIEAGGTTLASDIVLAEDETRQFDLTLERGEQSVIQGLLVDTAGQPQANLTVIAGRGEVQIASVQTGNDGRYRVEGLAAGSYWVITGDGAAAVAGIVLDGWNTETVDLTVPAASGFRYVVTEKRLLDPQETGNDRKFYGRIFDQAGHAVPMTAASREGLNGVAIEMAWIGADPGSQFPRQTTPKDPFKPAGNFEFLHSPGEFLLRVVQGDWPSDEAGGLLTGGIPGREGDPITWEVNFQLQAAGGQDGTGVISGTISNGDGLGLTLWLTPPVILSEAKNLRGRSWAVVLPAGGAYRLENLPAGHFRLELEGQGQIGSLDLAEGGNVVFDYTLPGPGGGSTLRGALAYSNGLPAAGLTVWLVQESGDMRSTETGADGRFQFLAVPAGIYDLFVDHPDGSQVLLRGDLHLDGQAEVTINVNDLTPPAPADKPLASYVFFGGREGDALLLELVMPYLRANGLTGGFKLDEAFQAASVSIVGGEDVVSSADEQRLVAAGCQVQRWPDDAFALAEALNP